MPDILERPDIAQVAPLIRGKIREVMRQYGGYVDADDLHQEVHMWWLAQKPELLVEYLADEKRLRLRRAVWRVARDTAERYRRQVTTTEPFEQVYYHAAEIMLLLPVALDPDGLPETPGVQEGPRPHRNLAEGGDVIASLIDVRRALDALDSDDRNYLQHARRVRWNYDLIGPALSIEPDSARRRVARICERMARWLNHEENT